MKAKPSTSTWLDARAAVADERTPSAEENAAADHSARRAEREREAFSDAVRSALGTVAQGGPRVLLYLSQREWGLRGTLVGRPRHALQTASLIYISDTLVALAAYAAAPPVRSTTTVPEGC